jgi:putative ABC transport system permease protein
MVAVTLADLAYRYRQFMIAVFGAGVVMAMALLLAGLAQGFAAETTQTVGGVGADRWVITVNSGGRIAAVGVFPQSDVARIAATRGVTRADPLALLPQEVLKTGGKTETVNVMGVRVGGLGDPHVSAGRPLSGSGQVVVDTSLGIPVGTVVQMGATPFRVVGQIEGRTLLGGGSMVYMPLRDAQVLTLGGRALVTAAVTKGVPSTVPAGLEVLTDRQVEQNTLEALGPGVSSINNSKILMWVIAGIIIAALLYVSALQRVRDFAVLKALGSSSTALLGSLAFQAVVVALGAAAFAAVISNFMGGVFQQPVDIPATAYYSLPVIAVVVGLLSSLVALRQATGADPAAAFGG